MAKRHAQLLLALEARIKKTAAPESLAALQVCERLRPHLATLLGTYGYQAIVARALRLASAEVPWLITLHILPSGAWEIPEQLETKITAEELTHGNLVLVAHLLGLLLALMGEEVTFRQLHEVWSNRRPEPGENGDEPFP